MTPFELKSVNLCNPLHARAFDGNQYFDGYKAEVARRWGVLCFSEDKSDVLQWSHYADRHQGMCLGFDVSGAQAKFGRVNVCDRPIPLSGERETRCRFYVEAAHYKIERMGV